MSDKDKHRIDTPSVTGEYTYTSDARRQLKTIPERRSPVERRSTPQVDVSSCDVLLAKMDMMISSQESVITKIDEFSKILYDPSDGLFSRLKDIEVLNKQTKTALDDHIKEDDESSKDNDIEITGIKKSIEPIIELVRWRDRINKSLFWLVSGLGTTLIGLLGKLLYDYFAARHGLPK